MSALVGTAILSDANLFVFIKYRRDRPFEWHENPRVSLIVFLFLLTSQVFHTKSSLTNEFMGKFNNIHISKYIF